VLLELELERALVPRTLPAVVDVQAVATKAKVSSALRTSAIRRDRPARRRSRVAAFTPIRRADMRSLRRRDTNSFINTATDSANVTLVP